MALQRYFLSIFIIFLGFLSFQINADGIASVNSYVEIKSSATDFRARKQSNNGQRSTSGFDFIITPERTNICQGLSNSICNSTYNFSGLGYVPTGSATSIVFADTLANSYLVFINDNHNSRDDRTSMIGQIVFDYEILGYWTDPSMTVDFDYVDKVGATYPTSGNSGFSARQTEDHVHYGSSTTSSTTSGDWVSIGSDKRTLRFGSKNGKPGDYIRVITRAANPTVDFNTTSSSGAESVSSKAITVDLSSASTQNVTVDYAVTGTATGSGTDYTLANGTLTIGAGEKIGIITITDIIDDDLNEEDETVIVTLSNPNNAILGTDVVHTYTITDNDSLPKIDFNINSSESDEPSSSINITVDISSVSGRKISVDYQFTGTANGSGIDHDLTDGTLTIDPGENNGIITIPNIIDDDLAEGDETIIITLSNPINATLGDDNIYTHTILANDDDKRPILISTSPKDDTIRVPVDSDIILTFNKVVSCESGTINIESEDNSSSFTVSLPNDIVTGCGTDTISINLPTDLEYETEYYVLIENATFKDTLGNSYKGITDKTEFNFRTPFILTDPTLKQPVIDNAKAMTQIATRWVDKNIDVISKRMSASSRQGLRVNFNNNIIDSIKTIGVTNLDETYIEEPIVEFCRTSSSGPKTDPSIKIKVHMSSITTENIAVKFNVTGSSDIEDFSYGEGILNIDAGLQFGIINIDDIPQDRFGFIQGDRKIILTLTESTNSQLGNNLVYTHTLTDDQNAWTDPNVNYFCVSDFDNPRSSEPILVKSSSNSGSVDDSSLINDLDSQTAFEDINSEVSIMNINAEQDQLTILKI